MALAAAEARATAAEEELEVLREALAASAPSNASNDNELIKALERERDAALDARDAAEEARAKAERQLSQSIDSVKDGAKGALSQLQKDAKTDKDAAVKKAVEDVKVEAKKKIAAVKEKLKAVQDFAKKRDEECKAAEAKLAEAEASRTTALDDVKAQLRHAQTQCDDALRQARTPVVATPTPQKGDDARLRAALDALDNERDANARLRADFERYKRRSNKVLRGAKKPRGKDAGAAAADRATLVAADAAIAASRTSAAAQKQAQDAMTSAVKVAARLAHAKAAEAKRKARLAIQAAQKRPAAPPPAPAPAAPAGEGWDDDDDRPEAPGLVARMLDAEISLPFFRRGGGSS
jgi:ParB family chromosome partitioning protein